MNLRPYAVEPWFLAVTKDQQIVFETRLGILLGESEVTRTALIIAWKEAKMFDNAQAACE